MSATSSLLASSHGEWRRECGRRLWPSIDELFERGSAHASPLQASHDVAKPIGPVGCRRHVAGHRGVLKSDDHEGIERLVVLRQPVDDAPVRNFEGAKEPVPDDADAAAGCGRGTATSWCTRWCGDVLRVASECPVEPTDSVWIQYCHNRLIPRAPRRRSGPSTSSGRLPRHHRAHRRAGVATELHEASVYLVQPVPRAGLNGAKQVSPSSACASRPPCLLGYCSSCRWSRARRPRSGWCS